MNPISVLLVDDNPTFLRIVTRFLQEHDDVVVVGAVGGSEEALAQARALQPQVVLLELGMSGLTGLETIPRLRSMIPEVGIIAMTLLDTNVYRSAVLAAGASDFVPKATLNTDLLPAIRRVAQGDRPRQGPADKTAT